MRKYLPRESPDPASPVDWSLRWDKQTKRIEKAMRQLPPKATLEELRPGKREYVISRLHSFAEQFKEAADA